jgi:hypothetical protein
LHELITFDEMNPVLFVLTLLILFGGGIFYMGGPAIGSGVFVLLLLVCIGIYLKGGFHRES